MKSLVDSGRIELYANCPACINKECLLLDLCYCMSDVNNITPNSNFCKKKITSSMASFHLPERK